MRLLIAFLLPWLTFFTIGWIPATIWAVYSLSQYNTDQKIRNALR